jgi:hypothetical protein
LNNIATVGLAVLTTLGSHTTTVAGEQAYLGNDGYIHVSPAIDSVVAAVPARDDNLTVIFSNFSDDPRRLYDKHTGWAVFGRTPPWGNYAGAAMPFTPTSNALLKKISVALSNVNGTNAANVSLNADAGGVPGAVIKRLNISNMPGFGKCCEVQTAASEKGIPLVAGTRYWVVLFASKKLQGTQNAWNRNAIGQTDQPAAVFMHNAWTSTAGAPGAFEVLGTPY